LKTSRDLIITILLAVTIILFPIDIIWVSAVGDNMPKLMNHLADEKSPYLLQHADNPVDWYPWADEAFLKAKREDKPIFLSIGYSTCHWCHVMEHESFENAQVAGLMNDAFVSIKVDREERPDIDNIYMNACRLMTGGGGWPLTIIMTPDKKPFFAATYIPRQNSGGRVGMIDLIPRVKEIWNTRKAEISEDADQVLRALVEMTANTPSEDLDDAALQSAFFQFKKSFDQEYGGFGIAPKFPSPHNFMFLLRYWKRSGDSHALEMVERSLQSMRRGGIYDHIGHGFHRYSTDSRWLVPHFEKMLYDQALLTMAYTETYQATGKKEYEETAREIIDYVLRDMTDSEGGFYCAEDADSEGEEGKFYFWSEAEIRKALNQYEAGLIIDVYNIKAEGNFKEQATGKETAYNIPHMTDSWSRLAERFRVPREELRNKTYAASRKLFLAREKRVHPHKDDKILSDWNGLMIAALAKASRVFKEPEYAGAAERAADFILNNLRDGDGRLLHRYRDGQAGLTGNIDDYAFLIFGFVELYEATFDVRYLEKALDLNEIMIRHFWDDDKGGFFFAPDDGEQLLTRQKEIYDGAVPSGNSVASYNLWRLARLTGRTEYEQMSLKIGRVFAGNVRDGLTGFSFLLCAADFGLGPSSEIVIVGNIGSEDTRDMFEAINRPFLPNIVVIFKPNEGNSKDIEKIAPYVAYQNGLGEKATAYVCRDFKCDLPTANAGEILNRIESQTR